MSFQNLTKEAEHFFMELSINNPVLEEYRVGYITISAIISIVVTLSNAFILLLFYQERFKLKCSHKFIISMALCDFINGSIFMPIVMYKYVAKITADSDICPKIDWILVATFQTTFFVCTSTTIDRFWAVVCPLHYRIKMEPKVANAMIIISWLIPWSLGLAHLLTFERHPQSKDLVCILVMLRPLWIVEMSSKAINLLTMLVCYIFIHRAIMKILKRRGSECYFIQIYKIIFRKSENDDKTDLDIREIRCTLLITLVFITFLPSTLHYLIIGVNPGANNMRMKLLVDLLACISSIFNPILYAFNIKNVRKAAKKLVYRMVTCGKVSQDVSSNSATGTSVSTSLGHKESCF